MSRHGGNKADKLSKVDKIGSDGPDTEEVLVYTDGSCDTGTGAGGWAYLLRYGDAEKEASGFETATTNNRMELLAAVRALEALKRPCRVRLVTDSQYLKKAFTDGWLDKWLRTGWQTANKQPVKNQDLWRQLLELSRVHELAWQWTRGHAGEPENERVDRLALTARKQGAARGGSERAPSPEPQS